ncbi:hypothetical protein NADFUDRAFT_84276 [Nadsonia fulvescens var. elongata DSM 6958]|uniref:Clu domain-containing protein n=1 Tax=Nadsonia fulvescens var. elongata DSM 6958 TaxID=857566 RepID=A0A1E3PEB5_9ASCO|nr:hypothetical protein NADFUDRAFT_84276 [Nadsonia fulvescens var. elongata DSM 6958]
MSDTNENNHPEQEVPMIEPIEIAIKFPSQPEAVNLTVFPVDTVNDIRQYIIDSSFGSRTCFSLWFQNEKLNEFIEIGTLDLQAGSVLELKEDPYNEESSRYHIQKVRESLGFNAKPSEDSSGYDAGISAFSQIRGLEPASQLSEDASDEEKEKYLAKLATEAKEIMESFDISMQPKISSFLPSKDTPLIPGAKIISLSHWNPAPANLRIKGDILYLQVTTLENDVFHIVSHVSGYYVSNTTGSKFDSSPKKINGKFQKSHSLYGLLQVLSPQMVIQIAKNQEILLQKDASVYLPPSNAFLTSPWLVYNPSAPKPDMTRTQTIVSKSPRDWNEELQSTREMKKDNIQDRLLRERLLNKLHHDFTEVATKGAIAIARGEVASQNPDEAQEAQIFLHNGIFFSYGSDSVGTFATEGGNAAARVAVGKDLEGVNLVNQLDVDGICPLATVIVDYCGKRIVAQSPVPGIFNQGASDEIDEAGEPIVASKIKYGSVEGKDIVANDEKFLPYFTKIAEAFHLQPHAITGKDNQAVELVTSLETKGWDGTDGRKYILDLYRTTPIDIEFLDSVDASDSAYPHRLAFVRHEAVEEWWRYNVSEFVKEEKAKLTESNQSISEGEEEAKIDLSKFSAVFNPDSFTSIADKKRDEQTTKDESKVREISKFVSETLISGFVADIKNNVLNTPLDGFQLAKTLHKRGINLRYMGKILDMIKEDDKDLAALKSLLVRQIVSRSVKHIVNSISSKLSFEIIPYAIVHIFNCLVGYQFNSKPEIELESELKEIYASTNDFSSFVSLTPDSVQKAIEKEAFVRFRTQLQANWIEEIGLVQLFRELSIMLGLQWRQADYKFTAASVVETSTTTTSKTKKSKAVETSKTTFAITDLVNILPVVKTTTVKSTLAEETLEACKVSIAQGKKELGLELLGESLSIHEQVYGLVHPEVSKAYSQVALLYNELDQKDLACEFGKKAVIISERVNGIDSTDTIFVYLNLALFQHANGNTIGALNAIKHAFQYWLTMFGINHPDTITTMTNIAIMLSSLKLFQEAKGWYERSLTLASDINGEQSISVATLHFMLAQSYASLGEIEESIKYMRLSHGVFLTLSGSEDKNTLDAANWIEQLEKALEGKHNAELAAEQQVKVEKFTKAAAKLSPQQRENILKKLNVNNDGSAISKEELEKISVDELLKFIEIETADSPAVVASKTTKSSASKSNEDGSVITTPGAKNKNKKKSNRNKRK